MSVAGLGVYGMPDAMTGNISRPDLEYCAYLAVLGGTCWIAAGVGKECGARVNEWQDEIAWSDPFVV